jgi:hypothetical protein
MLTRMRSCTKDICISASRNFFEISVAVLFRPHIRGINMRNCTEPFIFLRNSNELSVLSKSMRRNAIFKARNGIQTLLKQHRGSSARLDKRPCLASLGTRCWRLSIHKQSFLTSSLQLRNREADSEGGFVQGGTIYALSTAPGRAGIAIVRISGPSCLDVWISINQ